METQALFTTSWDDFLRYAAERIPAERRLSNREVLRHRAANSR